MSLSETTVTPTQQIWAGVAQQNPELRPYAEMPVIERTATLAGTIVAHGKQLNVAESGILDLDARLVQSNKAIQQLEAVMGHTRNEVYREGEKLALLCSDYHFTTTKIIGDLHQARIEIANLASLTLEQKKQIETHILNFADLLGRMAVLETEMQNQKKQLLKNEQAKVTAQARMLHLRIEQMNLRLEISELTQKTDRLAFAVTIAIGFTVALAIVGVVVARRQHLKLNARVEVLEGDVKSASNTALEANNRSFNAGAAALTATNKSKEALAATQKPSTPVTTPTQTTAAVPAAVPAQTPAATSAPATASDTPALDSARQAFNTPLFEELLNCSQPANAPPGLNYFFTYAAARLKNEGASREQVVDELVTMLASWPQILNPRKPPKIPLRELAVSIVNLIQKAMPLEQFTSQLRTWFGRPWNSYAFSNALTLGEQARI